MRRRDEKQQALIDAAPVLLVACKDLVRCIRDGQLGDYSPLMDEIFDAEHAIAEAELDMDYLQRINPEKYGHPKAVLVSPEQTQH